MTTYSKNELRDEVLQNIGVLGQGQTVSAEDDAKALRAIQAAFEELETEGILPMSAYEAAGVSNIPANAFHALSEFVETFVRPAFGGPRDVQLRLDAMRRIRRVVVVGVGQPARFDNF